MEDSFLKFEALGFTALKIQINKSSWRWGLPFSRQMAIILDKESTMLDKDGEAVANRLVDKLEARGFVKASSKNSGDYTSSRQDMDSKAVEDFVETDLFQTILEQQQ